LGVNSIKESGEYMGKKRIKGPKKVEISEENMALMKRLYDLCTKSPECPDTIYLCDHRGWWEKKGNEINYLGKGRL
jgi:hypothetical protein